MKTMTLQYLEHRPKPLNTTLFSIGNLYLRYFTITLRTPIKVCKAERQKLYPLLNKHLLLMEDDKKTILKQGWLR